MTGPGPDNSILDIDGLAVGQASDPALRSGVTLLLCEAATAVAVDVRGGGPATRETDLLAPDTLTSGAHAIVLSGGSVFGLAAADGVATALAHQGTGLRIAPGAPPVPLVPAACIFDLTNGGEKDWGDNVPYARLGREALAAADAPLALGSAGAGYGATAGLWRGGIGSASLVTPQGTVAALVVANPVGSPLVPDASGFWAAPMERGEEFGGLGWPGGMPRSVAPIPDDAKLRPGNTVIGIVATDADLTAPETRRLAMMAHDGIARAVRPSHTPYDGDTLFAVSMGARPLAQERGLDLMALGAAAADCVARALARGVWLADDAAGHAPCVRSSLRKAR